MPIANHKLDYAQTLKNAYDITKNRFRVDAEVSATFGDLEVSLISTEDSVAIGNTAGTNFLAINPDGSVNVVVTSIPDSGDIFRLVPFEIDDIEVTSKNSDGDPLTVVYSKSASIVATLTLLYDADGDFERVTRT